VVFFYDYFLVGKQTTLLVAWCLDESIPSSEDIFRRE